MAKSRATNQRVIIKLSNGRQGVFSGRAIAWPGECENVDVVEVKFLVPTRKGKGDGESNEEATPASAQETEKASPPKEEKTQKRKRKTTKKTSRSKSEETPERS